MILGGEAALVLLGLFGIAGALFGLLAGWVASKVRGARFSQPISNVLIGVLGVYLANWCGVWLGELVSLATVGALVLLIAIWRVPQALPPVAR